MSEGRLTYEDLTHPLIKNRIVLDYPLDVLLNRDCQLQDYEQGVMAALEEYNTEKNKLWNRQPLERPQIDHLQNVYSKLSADFNNNNLKTEIDQIEVDIRKKSQYKVTTEKYIDNFIKIIFKKLECENDSNISIVHKVSPQTIRVHLESTISTRAKQTVRKSILKPFFDLIAINLAEIISFNNLSNYKHTEAYSSLRKTLVNTIVREKDKTLREEKTLRIAEKYFTDNTKPTSNALPDSIASSQVNPTDEIFKNSTISVLYKYLNVFCKARGKIGSLVLRQNKDEWENESAGIKEDVIGSGNILIKGRPGSGKSTLALQMAVACTFPPNHYSSIYISFEESIHDIQLKAREFNWEDKLYPIQFLDTIDDTSSPEDIANALLKVMTQPFDCSFRKPSHNTKDAPCSNHCHENSDHQLVEPRVYLPLLSPRGMTFDNVSKDELFWERYRQLERLLTGIEYLRKPPGNHHVPDIRMVCIDSLNVFGDDTLSRNELFKLFDLFKSKGVIGVFTAEQEAWITKQPVGESIEDYLSDIIIQLHMEDDAGYANRYFEVTKSRYQHQVYGIHPLRLRGLETQRTFRKQLKASTTISESIFDQINNSNGFLTNSIKIEKNELSDGSIINDDIRNNFIRKLESAFYLRKLYAKKTEQNILTKVQIEKLLTTRHNFFQPITIQPSLHFIVYSTEMQSLSRSVQRDLEKFDIGCIKLNSYIKHNLTQGSIVTIKGPRSTYKTNVAQNFLLDGLTRGENTLLITFKERSSVTLKANNDISWMREKGKRTFEFSEEKYDSLEDPKRIFKLYKDTKINSCLIELTLKSGALQPEELLEFVRDILREDRCGKKINRVVLDDVALIGSSYPYLRHSKTSGDLFLSAFVHVMKNYNINLVITGTIGQMKEADEMVDRACELSDSVLSFDFCDVFGDRYVTISGDGMHSLSSDSHGQDVVPAVIKVNNNETETSSVSNTDCYPSFTIDTELLQGLVGFGTPHIYRPGLRLYTFKEGTLLFDYNRELQAMLSSSLGISWRENYESVTSTLKPGDTSIPHSPLQNQDISVVSFDSTMSSALHDSLDLLKNKPIDSTVLYTIDEFWLCKDASKTSINIDEHAQISNSFHDITDLRQKAIHHPDYLNIIDQTPQVIPYYGNVLLIAYRKDLIDFNFNVKYINNRFIRQAISWENLASLCENTFLPSGIKVPYMLDGSAAETVACVMLDAFSKLSFDNNQNIKFQYNEDDSTKKSIHALQKILNRSYHDARKITNDEILKPQLKDNVMHPHAGVYICWYSQLREMINAYPHLASELDVCCLPGGGIRGDWYLGVAKGSVSTALGKRVISILTSKKEQYKRFSMGVGLPTLNEFYTLDEPDDFYAWQRAIDVKLKDLQAIHGIAHSRAEIPGYKEFRTMLYTIGKQLITPKSTNKMDTTEIDKIVSRIQKQYELMIAPEKQT